MVKKIINNKRIIRNLEIEEKKYELKWVSWKKEMKRKKWIIKSVMWRIKQIGQITEM